MITVPIFEQVFPNATLPNDWVSRLTTLLQRNNIIGKAEVAMFLAQTGVESGGYRTFQENLNYSAQGLLSTFPHYFSPTTANQFARNPQAIANRVYGCRLGNGTEDTGDGWKYRGRGLIQITGKTNYKSFFTYINHPEYLDTPDVIISNRDYIIQTATWFWTVSKLNNYSGDVEKTTKIINGGTNGLQQRQAYYTQLMGILLV